MELVSPSRYLARVDDSLLVSPWGPRWATARDYSGFNRSTIALQRVLNLVLKLSKIRWRTLCSTTVDAMMLYPPDDRTYGEAYGRGLSPEMHNAQRTTASSFATLGIMSRRCYTFINELTRHHDGSHVLLASKQAMAGAERYCSPPATVL